MTTKTTTKPAAPKTAKSKTEVTPIPKSAPKSKSAPKPVAPPLADRMAKSTSARNRTAESLRKRADKAAAKTAPKPVAEPVAETAPTVCELTGFELLDAAKAEHEILKTWSKDGSKPPKPLTPAIDKVNAENAAGRRIVSAKTSRKSTKSSEPTLSKAGRPKLDDDALLDALVAALVKLGADASPSALRREINGNGFACSRSKLAPIREKAEALAAPLRTAS